MHSNFNELDAYRSLAALSRYAKKQDSLVAARHLYDATMVLSGLYGFTAAALTYLKDRIEALPDKESDEFTGLFVLLDLGARVHNKAREPFGTAPPPNPAAEQYFNELTRLSEEAAKALKGNDADRKAALADVCASVARLTYGQ